MGKARQRHRETGEIKKSHCGSNCTGRSQETEELSCRNE